MSIYSKNTLLIAFLWVLSLSGFAQKTPNNLKATYREFNEIRLDWQATLAKGEFIKIKRTYKNDKKAVLERTWHESVSTFTDRKDLKQGDYIYQIQTVAANGKQSAWSNQAIGAILTYVLETPKIKASIEEFTDRIEIAYEGTLREGESVKIERRGRDMGTDRILSKITFTQAFESIPLEPSPDGRLIDKAVNQDVGVYQYRIKIVDKNGNESAWSAPVVRSLKRE